MPVGDDTIRQEEQKPFYIHPELYIDGAVSSLKNSEFILRDELPFTILFKHDKLFF